MHLKIVAEIISVFCAVLCLKNVFVFKLLELSLLELVIIELLELNIILSEFFV